jgi:hypothetical protein
MKWDLRSKIGIWQMPLFKFLHPEIWRWNLHLDGMKRLKYRIPNFGPKMPIMLMMQMWMQDFKSCERWIYKRQTLLLGKTVTFIGEPHKWLDWGRENNEKGRKMIQLHWWSKVVSLGKRLHIICLMRPELPVYQGNMKRWYIIYYHWSDSLKDNEIKYYQLSYKR